MIQNIVLSFSIIINFIMLIIVLKKDKSKTLEAERKEKPDEKSNKKSIVATNISQITAIGELDDLEKKMNDRFEDSEKSTKEILQLINTLKNDTNDLKNYISLKEKDKNEPFIRQTETNSEPKKSIERKPIVEEEEEKPTIVELSVPKNENIYLPSPFEEKKFSVEDASKIRKDSSLYCIKLDASSEILGEIYILEDADFTIALNSPKQYLEPVCDFENSYSTNAKRVENIERGQAKKEGDDWIVTKKMTIKFI